MRTHMPHSNHFNRLDLSGNQSIKRLPSLDNNGLISEFVYDEEHTTLSLLLLPLLQYLGMQSRWLLWLSPQQKLNRNWLIQSGLPMDKMIQINQLQGLSSVDAMAKALQTGNYSVVLGWLPELSDADREKLQVAAKRGGAYGFIMKPQNSPISAQRQLPTVKIHSTLYH